MINLRRGFEWKVVILMVTVGLVSCGAVNWTDLPELRMAQTSIYDTVYIPVNTNSQVDITYLTPFAAPFSNSTILQALVLSGFENYLHFQMIMNVTIISVYQAKITINIWVGPQTYVKQMRVNYLIMQKGIGTLDSFIAVSTGNYRTLDLDDANGPRYQYFTAEPSPFSSIVNLCSAINGFEYYNTDGIVNQINVNTSLINTPSNLIAQNVTVGEKGRLNYISITTILIATGFYPNPNTYPNLGVTFESTIENNLTGFDVLTVISNSNLFASAKNSFFFGMNSFNFTMQGSRLFLLEISTNSNFSSNLATNKFMKYTVISALVLVKRVCNTSTDFYYVEGFSCMPSPCMGLYQDTTNQVCQKCLGTCNGCLTSVGDCQNCAAGTNRVVTPGGLPSTCQCNFNSGYVQVNKKEVCQLCSTYLPGCVKCMTPLSCDDCGNTVLYQNYIYDAANNKKCRCKNGKYLVTGKCLSYPGCLEANQYVTGEFCEKCDAENNFEKDLTNNSSCKCMLAYFRNPKNSSQCIDICGDGRTPASPLNATQSQIICDDNNTISGDGCSSTCRQQFGYTCNVQFLGGISNCVQKQQITITYLYSEKNLISNEATIVFALLPAQHFLDTNAFDGSVYASMQGAKKIQFDPVNSLIIITVDYTETLEGNSYEFDFSLSSLKIYSSNIKENIQLNGRNAKLQIGVGNQQVNIIIYVALAVSAFALVLALVAAFLGEKMMGIELILPVQAAYFTMVTFPRSLLSPISALWSMKFSNGYNSLSKFDLTTNYMLDSRITLLQYSGQYLLNYNIMFSLLALVIVIIAIIAIRVAWLEREENRIQELLRKLQDEEKDSKQQGSKKIKKQKVKEQQDKQDKQDKQKSTDQQENSSDKETKQNTQKDDQANQQLLQEELQDAREGIKNWKNFLYMIFDRFFAIFIITAMMKVIFCFYIQLSNLTYTNEVFNNSLNAGFFFLTYGTIVTGLYAIVYDYKTDKFIIFTCNKSKYAMFYIGLYLAFIIVLGATYQSDVALYAIAVFPIVAVILIPYQVPYGMRVLDLQTIIAIICQFPFLATVVVSFILNFQKSKMTQQACMIFAYVIIGTIGLSIILTIARMIKLIDCKKISCIEFTDRKKDGKNDKNKKKNKILVIDELDLPKDNWEEYSQDSVRSVLHEKNQDKQKQEFNIEKQNKQAYDAIAKKNQPKPLQKDKQKVIQEQEDDEQIDELQKIKIKLRKDLKQKKMVGKVK